MCTPFVYIDDEKTALTNVTLPQSSTVLSRLAMKLFDRFHPKDLGQTTTRGGINFPAVPARVCRQMASAVAKQLPPGVNVSLFHARGF